MTYEVKLKAEINIAVDAKNKKQLLDMLNNGDDWSIIRALTEQREACCHDHSIIVYKVEEINGKKV